MSSHTQNNIERKNKTIQHKNLTWFSILTKTHIHDQKGKPSLCNFFTEQDYKFSQNISKPQIPN